MVGGSEEHGRLDVEEEGGGLKIVGKGRFLRIVGGSMVGGRMVARLSSWEVRGGLTECRHLFGTSPTPHLNN